MEYRADPIEVVLPHQRLLRIRDGEGLIIEVVEGRLWLTRERDRKDHIVKAGQSIAIEGAGLTLVSTFDAGRLRLRKTSAANSPVIEIDGQRAHTGNTRALPSLPERLSAAALALVRSIANARPALR